MTEIFSFYCFTPIKAPEEVAIQIYSRWINSDVKGTILLATEGVNGSISAQTKDIKGFWNYINNVICMDGAIYKSNYAEYHVFSKFKVKVKPEIIKIGLADLDILNQDKQELQKRYIEPQSWDSFIMQDDVVLVDTRNDYEVKEGTFKGAVNPETRTFCQFPEWVEKNKEAFKNKKIAMFCTGGVRCEKSTAYFASLGYKDVYHLKGGVLQYFQETQNANHMWEGNCFVFDDRYSVDSTLEPSDKPSIDPRGQYHNIHTAGK